MERFNAENWQMILNSIAILMAIQTQMLLNTLFTTARMHTGLANSLCLIYSNDFILFYVN
jgi:hypothetical protein